MSYVIAMLRYVVVLVFLAAAHGASLKKIDGKIVNGTNAVIEDFPYQISLQHYSVHRCGGSMIGKRFVVTAAHCTIGTKLEKLTIRAGTTFKELDGQVVKVAKVHQHPKYNKINQDYDLSVLELEEDITIDEAEIIEMVDGDFKLPLGEMAWISGWGRLGETTPGPEQLQSLSVPLLDLKVCKKAYGSYLTNRMMCAGYIEGGRDSCQGDSGGPLALDGKLLGVVSFGRGCARPGFPGVYASIPSLRSYIKEVSGI